jgi:farnesyl diphosphate synthase
MFLELQTYQQRINVLLSEFLSKKIVVTGHLQDAMIYAIKNGGKRFRPILVYACGKACDISLAKLDNVAMAIELIHTYSLIHDDLPAMDNDDLRRGKPTLHKKYDEATAILAGDAMQALAFEILFATDDKKNMQAGRILSHAAGLNGMAGGQMLDLQATNQKLSVEELVKMHRKKTGKLIEACFSATYVFCDNLSTNTRNNIDSFSHKIGLLFQVIDDILDATTDEKILGKPAKSDIKQNKATFISILGLQKSKDYANKIYKEAIQIVDKLPTRFKNLTECATFVLKRKF